MLRIALIYAPPWKLARAGKAPYAGTEGPPEGGPFEQFLRGDSEHVPLGLLSLAAQAHAAGHDVRVLNLFAFAWQDIEQIIASIQADLFGLSCFTLNRRGTLLLAELIRRLHPHAHITLGGPHASVLPREILEQCSAIDTVVIGEGEQTFMELVSRIENKNDLSAIAGTAFRTPQGTCIAEPRAPIADLDFLVPPARYFNDHIVLSARGCAWDCSFCASRALWGRGIRTHSADYVLDMLETLVREHGQRAIAFKDETFTADRQRALALCRGIRARSLNIAWSCDTRADVLDAELLTAMRASGCQRLSLGVESADEGILKQLNKKISPSAVREATLLARQTGLSVRYYMIVGSPGETMATLQRSLDFVREAGPVEVIFNPFTLLPGTREWERALHSSSCDPHCFFTDTFFELQPLARDSGPEAAELRNWLLRNSGLQQVRPFSVKECRESVRLFPGLALAHLDLANALLHAGDYEAANQAVQQALDADHPLPGLCRNVLACSANRQGNLTKALEHLMAAAECGCHHIVEHNIASAQRWAAMGGPKSGLPLELVSDTGFEVSRIRRQPIGPGEIAIAGRIFKPAV
jgi:anaerobic magnesium-protoporphyrin IX monomethyl ester cyclase